MISGSVGGVWCVVISGSVGGVWHEDDLRSGVIPYKRRLGGGYGAQAVEPQEGLGASQAEALRFRF